MTFLFNKRLISSLANTSLKNISLRFSSSFDCPPSSTQSLKGKDRTTSLIYTQNGVNDEVNFNRNENGLIKDNLIIKGNNLLALHTLKSNFAGKVKLIYLCVFHHLWIAHPQAHNL
jgi:hypothetical protein